MTSPKPGTKLRVESLRALMSERGWRNWTQLAVQAGMSPSSVTRLVNGEMELTGQTIAQLLHAFPRVRFEDLFDDGRNVAVLVDVDEGPGDAA